MRVERIRLSPFCIPVIPLPSSPLLLSWSQSCSHWQNHCTKPLPWLEQGHISNTCRMALAGQFIVLGKWDSSAFGNIIGTIICKLINSICSAWCGKNGLSLTVPVWEKCTLSVSTACAERLRGHVAHRKLRRKKIIPFYWKKLFYK